MVRPEKLRNDSRVKVPPGKEPTRPVADLSTTPGGVAPSVVSKAPEGRERSRSPQHQVKPVASTDYQPNGGREGRAEHVTAKATDKPPSVGARLDLSGVEGAGCDEGRARDRRDPSRQPTSGKDRADNATPKPDGAGRESEGLVVPTKAAGQIAGGKEPCSGLACEGGEHEGVAERPSNPVDEARELQNKLWACAKRSRTRRFYALLDRIYRSDVLREAWKRVRGNRGAAGIDGQSIEDVEAYGVERWLSEIQAKLRAGEYRPTRVRRRYIPKSDGKQRPLAIPTVRDRVVQMAKKVIIEPIFEADFEDCSCGFRPKTSPTDALEAVREAGNQGLDFVVDADIKAYFGSIDQDKLLAMVERRLSDRPVVKLIRQWLRAGVMEEGTLRETSTGTPQGGVISPLLANIYLHAMDRDWNTRWRGTGRRIRYADDFVIMCDTKAKATLARKKIGDKLTDLGLALHPERTRLVDLGNGKEGFVFLGCAIRKRRSIQRAPWKHYMQRWTTPKAMTHIRTRLHELTAVRGNPACDLRAHIDRINPVLRGWGNYFRTGNADHHFNQIDDYTHCRLTQWVRRRARQRNAFRQADWPHSCFDSMGLHRLRGIVRFPTQAAPQPPSVSRVRETRTHGLKGGAGTGFR
ncbi:MAG: group II intron reverse transcriptase/maturase [Planctomycetia bacterium]|nr:group II intron reverse transcriptase/maturase [Planctomycetia bacterium]